MGAADELVAARSADFAHYLESRDELSLDFPFVQVRLAFTGFQGVTGVLVIAGVLAALGIGLMIVRRRATREGGVS